MEWITLKRGSRIHNVDDSSDSARFQTTQMDSGSQDDAYEHTSHPDEDVDILTAFNLSTKPDERSGLLEVSTSHSTRHQGEAGMIFPSTDHLFP